MWKKQDKKDKLIYESIKDLNGEEILSNDGKNIELYTIWGTKTTKWKKKE